MLNDMTMGRYWGSSIVAIIQSTMSTISFAAYATAYRWLRNAVKVAAKKLVAIDIVLKTRLFVLKALRTKKKITVAAAVPATAKSHFFLFMCPTFTSFESSKGCLSQLISDITARGRVIKA